MQENGFTLKKARSRQYPTETITDADYADDIALLANIDECIVWSNLETYVLWV